MPNTSITINMPEWLEHFYQQAHNLDSSIESKMDFTIKIAAQNINEGGGPFGATIFEKDSTNLISIGVNLVTNSHLSVAHAEIIAICAAQRKFSNHDLSKVCEKGVELFSTTEPCAMCTGAIPWSGVKRLIYATTKQDASDIGFDEGAKPENWIQEYEKRGIEVVKEVRRESARKVLLEYHKNKGIIY